MGAVSDKEANLESFFFNLPGCLSNSLIKAFLSRSLQSGLMS